MASIGGRSFPKLRQCRIASSAPLQGAEIRCRRHTARQLEASGGRSPWSTERDYTERKRFGPTSPQCHAPPPVARPPSACTTARIAQMIADMFRCFSRAAPTPSQATTRRDAANALRTFAARAQRRERNPHDALALKVLWRWEPRCARDAHTRSSFRTDVSRRTRKGTMCGQMCALDATATTRLLSKP